MLFVNQHIAIHKTRMYTVNIPWSKLWPQCWYMWCLHMIKICLELWEKKSFPLWIYVITYTVWQWDIWLKYSMNIWIQTFQVNVSWRKWRVETLGMWLDFKTTDVLDRRGARKTWQMSKTKADSLLWFKKYPWYFFSLFFFVLSFNLASFLQN